MWPDRHHRLILATVLKNCRLGSSPSSVLLKNNIPNSFKLLERPTPEELCYRLPSPALVSVLSQQHHSGLLHAFLYLFQATAVSNFPSQMHHF